MRAEWCVMGGALRVLRAECRALCCEGVETEAAKPTRERTSDGPNERDGEAGESDAQRLPRDRGGEADEKDQ